jgi:hypothetical protein
MVTWKDIDRVYATPEEGGGSSRVFQKISKESVPEKGLRAAALGEGIDLDERKSKGQPLPHELLTPPDEGAETAAMQDELGRQRCCVCFHCAKWRPGCPMRASPDEAPARCASFEPDYSALEPDIMKAGLRADFPWAPRRGAPWRAMAEARNAAVPPGGRLMAPKWGFGENGSINGDPMSWVPDGPLTEKDRIDGQMAKERMN